MKQFTVAAVYGGMIGHRCAKAAQQDIARLCGRQGNPVKTSRLHCPGTGSDHCATSHPHAQNPAYQFPPDGMHPGTGCNSPSTPVLKAPSRQVRHAAGICECHPGRPATRAVRFLSAAAVSLAQPGQTTGMTVDQCHNLPLHLCPQPVFRCNTKIRLRLCRDIHTRDIPLPSGVLTTKPHDSAGAHRRACARIADSVCVINRDLLRKFINGKETAKISHHAAHLTPAHALAASVLTDIRGGVVELIRHRRTVIPAFISPVIPHTGVRQHDATRKQRPVRLRRCCQSQTRPSCGRQL